MSEGTGQPANQPTRPRAAQGTRRTGSKHAQHAAPASPPAQETAAPLAAPDTTGSAALQALPLPVTSVRPAPNAPPLGERWGEFPTVERQAELKRMLEVWGQEQDHGDRPGPFARVHLTGADVYWLATFTTGKGDVVNGKKRLDEQPYTPLRSLHLEGSYLSMKHLEGANLVAAHLEGASLAAAHLEGANLNGAQLQGANLSRAHLEGVDLFEASLTRQVNLQEAMFDVTTQLAGAYLDTTLQVADVLWNEVPLTRVNWGELPHVGEEGIARFLQGHREYETAARAYRQLAIVLRSQGVTDVADRFNYRALIMQRKALWRQLRTKRSRALGSYLFSLFLAVLTGYGYRMSRIVVAYLLLIGGFATAYWSVGVHHPRDISFWTALIVSVTAFHGRVFTNPFAPNIPDAQVVITAIEAIVGLVIEGVFIAMLTQRFFNR